MSDLLRKSMEAGSATGTSLTNVPTTGASLKRESLLGAQKSTDAQTQEQDDPYGLAALARRHGIALRILAKVYERGQGTRAVAGEEPRARVRRFLAAQGAGVDADLWPVTVAVSSPIEKALAELAAPLTPRVTESLAQICQEAFTSVRRQSAALGRDVEQALDELSKALTPPSRSKYGQGKHKQAVTVTRNGKAHLAQRTVGTQQKPAKPQPSQQQLDEDYDGHSDDPADYDPGEAPGSKPDTAAKAQAEAEAKQHALNQQPQPPKVLPKGADPADAATSVLWAQHMAPTANITGVPFAPWQAPTDLADWATVDGQDWELEEPAIPEVGKKTLASGVILREPDGRVWLTKPTNGFGGYRYTLPKGGAEEGLSLQANAIKETFEETGLQVRITGFAGDVERSTSLARYYYAERVGGTPAAHGWEAEGVALVPPAYLHHFLNRYVDQALVHTYAGAPEPPPMQAVTGGKPGEGGPKGEQKGEQKPAGAGQLGLFGWGKKTPPDVEKGEGDELEKSQDYGEGKRKQAVTVKLKSGKVITQMRVVGKKAGKPGPQHDQHHFDPGVDMGKWNQEHKTVKWAHKKLAEIKQHVRNGDQAALEAMSLPNSNHYQKKVFQIHQRALAHIAKHGASKPKPAAPPATEPDTLPVPATAPVQTEPPHEPVAGAPLFTHGINTEKWPKANSAAVAAKKKLAFIETLATKGDITTLKMMSLPPATGKKMNPYQKAILSTHAKALAYITTHAAPPTVSEAPYAEANDETGSQAAPSSKPAQSDEGAIDEAIAALYEAMNKLNGIADGLNNTLYEAIEDESVSALQQAAAETQDYAAAQPQHQALYSKLASAATHLARLLAEPVPDSAPEAPAVSAASPEFLEKVKQGIALYQQVNALPPDSPEYESALEVNMIAFTVLFKSLPAGEQSAFIAATAQQQGLTPQADPAPPSSTPIVGNLCRDEKGHFTACALGQQPVAPPPVVAFAHGLDLSKFKQQDHSGYKNLLLKLTALEGLVNSGDMAGVKAVPVNAAGSSYQKAFAKAHQAALAFLEAPQALPAAEQQADAPVITNPANASTIPTTVGWANVGGQLGSNPGAQLVDPTGQKYYVKYSKSDNHAKNEILAAKLYELAGAPVMNYNLVDVGSGKLGTATKWVEDKQSFVPTNAAHLTQAVPSFAVHAWLANWDCIGLGYDNLAVIGGQMTALDTGGALLYRAQGQPKGPEFGDEVTEWDSLRKGQNSQTAAVFGQMTAAQLAQSASQVAAIPDDAISELVMAHGPGTPGERAVLAEKLLKRKADIVAKAAALGVAPPAVKANPAPKPVPAPAPAPLVQAAAPAFPATLTEANLSSPGNTLNQTLWHKKLAIDTAVSAFQHGQLTAAQAIESVSKHAFGQQSYHKKVAKYQAGVLAVLQAVGAGAQPAEAPVAPAPAPAPPPVPATPSAPAPAPTPVAKKKKAPPVLDISQLSKPVSFLSWGASGQPGPSGVLAVNEANHEAVEAVYKAAGIGGAAAIKALMVPLIDKHTGKKTGSVSVLESPSQHVKGYAQQLLNEIDFQLNPPRPPKEYRLSGNNPIAQLHAAMPAIAGHGAGAKALGRFLILGMANIASQVTPEALYGTDKKITYQNGKVTTHTYRKAAQLAWAKMPKPQQDAVKAYTGGDFVSMNNGLWKGNESDAAKSAKQAMNVLAHEVAPGTILSRKFTFRMPNGIDVDEAGKVKFLELPVGTVFQDPGIISTAITPHTWNGHVNLKITVGPGVKGLYVGPGSTASGGAISQHASENEIILPPNTRMVITKIEKNPKKDGDGFGVDGDALVHVTVLPSVFV